jgi:hypothetical protein
MATEYIKLADLPDYFNEELLRYFSYYSVALGRIRNNKAEEFIPLGTGVLVKKGNHFGILTARHCLHACKPPVEIGPSGCDTLTLVISRGRNVLVKPNEAIEHNLVEPKTEAFGPDLTFIEISGNSLATLKGVGSFWPLDKKTDEIINQFGKVGTPIVSIGFPQVDYKTEVLPEINTVNHRIRHMTFSNVIQDGDIYERDGWDYLESNMWYGGTPDLPVTFRGVSGGPVWGLQIKKDKTNGRLSIEKSGLIGITFYQTEQKGDERRLRAHFIKSIYDLAWRDLK